MMLKFYHRSHGRTMGKPFFLTTPPIVTAAKLHQNLHPPKLCQTLTFVPFMRVEAVTQPEQHQPETVH